MFVADIMSSESNHAFWEEFIGMYRSYPCLWDVKSKSYMDRNLKNLAMETLIEKCKEVNPSANKDYVAKKIHNMRCSFRRELKKIKNSKPTGTQTDDVYIPTLWYFDLLSFITDTEVPRKGTENISIDDLDIYDDDDDDKDENGEEVSHIFIYITLKEIPQFINHYYILQAYIRIIC